MKNRGMHAFYAVATNVSAIVNSSAIVVKCIECDDSACSWESVFYSG